MVLQIQEQLQLATRRCDDEKAAWQVRSLALEDRDRDLLRLVSRLRDQKRELQRMLQLRRPQAEIETAVEARNTAIRKYRHATRVVRDLVNERVNYVCNPNLSLGQP